MLPRHAAGHGQAAKLSNKTDIVVLIIVLTLPESDRIAKSRPDGSVPAPALIGTVVPTLHR